MRGLTLRQVAERFGVALGTARQWQRDGRFPNSRLAETSIGNVWIVPMSDLRKFKPPIMGRPKKTAKQKVRKSKGPR